ncbi:uncharacterized protein LOC133397058 isoform X2 [Phycodurus eques]|uniref:uncharacterized protein LOC133397058 isoform X2 n=1 Tax=Phycodurus eques TaxID=693459 RepID=UPI002ACD2C9E|nr:uncharacterized protein LOC133397058 isoform X2 [Phycodurus eques]
MRLPVDKMTEDGEDSVGTINVVTVNAFVPRKQTKRSHAVHTQRTREAGESRLIHNAGPTDEGREAAAVEGRRPTDTLAKRTPKPLSDTRSRVLQSIMGNCRCRAEDEREEKDHSGSSSLQQRAPRTAITHEEEKQQVASRNRTTSLLEELASVQGDLEASSRLHEQRTRDDGFLRQQENAHLWQNLHFLRLSQQLAKPWVSSYFRKFPVHIYCLPVQPADRRARKRGEEKMSGRGGAS